MIQNIQKASYINTIPPTSFGRASVARNNQSFLSTPIEDVVIINGQERSLRKKKKKDNTLNVILGLAVAALVIFGIYKLTSKSQTPKVETPPPEITTPTKIDTEINGVKFAGKLKPEELDPLAKKAMEKVDVSDLPEEFKNPALRNKFREQFKNLYHKESISEEELDQLISKYRKLVFLEGDDFITATYYQIKNDYGFGDIDMHLNINEMKADKNGNNLYGGYYAIKSHQTPNNSKVHASTMDISKDSEAIGIHINKKEMSDSIAHEFTHMYQDQIMFRTDPKRFKETYIEKLKKQVEAEKLSVTEDDIRAQADRVCTIFKNYYGDNPKIQQGTKEYEYAEQCFPWASRYVNADKELYQESFLENDARKKGAIMQNIIELIFNKNSATLRNIQ